MVGVIGRSGAGKSTLLEILAALCPAGEMTNDTTEAGLRQRMNQRAAPMILDEFEGEELLRVLAMLRRIVTGEGSRSFRGQGSQTAVVTEVVGTAVMGAIGAPVANSAETTRILRLMLWPRAPGVESLNKAALLEWCQKEAPALWGRAIAAWPRVRDNAAMMRLVLNKAGCSPRYADMLGWLIGAREAMVADLPLTQAQAEEALQWAWGWVVTEAEQAEDTTAARCLQQRVVVLDGGTGDDEVARRQLGRLRIDRDGDAITAKPIEHLAPGLVGTAHACAAALQELRKAAHAGATDSDEMDALSAEDRIGRR